MGIFSLFITHYSAFNSIPKQKGNIKQKYKWKNWRISVDGPNLPLPLGVYASVVEPEPQKP